MQKLRLNEILRASGKNEWKSNYLEVLWIYRRIKGNHEVALLLLMEEIKREVEEVEIIVETTANIGGGG